MHCVLSCLKITYRDDPSKRGVERTCTRVINKAAPSLPTVSVSPSGEVWEVRSDGHSSFKGTLNLQLISGKRKITFNLFEVFMVVFVLFFTSLAWEFCQSPDLHISYNFFFLWVTSIKPSWIFAMKFQWMCNSKADCKSAVVTLCSIPRPRTHILKVKVNVFVTFKRISDVNRRL